MATSRVLVTGATGLIGRQALTPLADLGFEVHAVSRTLPKKDAEALGIKPSPCHWHVADLLQPQATTTLLEKISPTHILHFAWYAEHGLYWKSPLNLAWLNATLHLISELARMGGKRFIGAGTCAEYDWDFSDSTEQPGMCYEEKTPLKPATLYGAAKASAYLTGKALAETQNLSFAWGRIFLLFGAGEDARRIVPSLIRAHLFGIEINCSQGTQERDFISSTALGEAFAHLAASDIQGDMNMGSGQTTTLRALSERIAQLVGQTGKVRFDAFHDAGPKKLVPNLQRLRQDLKWQHQESMDAALLSATNGWRTKPQ